MPKYPMSRAAALDSKARMYKTGRPCKYGHTAPRYTLTGGCSECSKISNQRARAKARAKLEE